MELNLERPLLFFDIESTGLNIASDSIIELCFVKIMPGGEQRVKTWRVKPWDYERQCQREINPYQLRGDLLLSITSIFTYVPKCNFVPLFKRWLPPSQLAFIFERDKRLELSP